MTIGDLPLGKRSLLIFNPDTDFALASGSDFYTPPVAAVNLAVADPMKGRIWGKPSDIILFPYPLPEENYPDGVDSVHFLTMRELMRLSQEEKCAFWDSISEIRPWGWNHSLRHSLLKGGSPEYLLLTLERLEDLRDLSHRRLTIPFNRMMGLAEDALPEECLSLDEAKEYLESHPGCWFKAPWSSSGRGVINSSTMSDTQVLNWVRGTIRRQGSVMAEPGADRVIDFATEWSIKNGSPRFVGFSLFETSERGKYQGNNPLSQSQIAETICSAAEIGRDVLEGIVNRQGETLKALVADRYEGPLGIDMLVDSRKTIRPCIEVNMRMTMGHLNIMTQIDIIGEGKVGKHLYSRLSALPGFNPRLVNSRTLEGLRQESDIYILTVSDSAIEEVSRRLRGDHFLVHVSGATPLSALDQGSDGPRENFGVFYMFQSFAEGVEVDFSNIPVLIEGSSERVTDRLLSLADRIARDGIKCNGDSRRGLHLAGVFASNFTNEMIQIAQRIMKDSKLPPELLEPLISMSVGKALAKGAENVRTGPAFRRDYRTIERHLALLPEGSKERKIYRLMTDFIIEQTDINY